MSGHHLVFNAPSGPCAVCGAKGTPCARCRVDYYCGKEHQRQDWPRHKVGCGVLELRTDERLGRYLVATKNIPVNTVIMREQPLIALPSVTELFGDNNIARVTCVGCYRILDLRKPGKPLQCGRCGSVVCSAACSKSQDHADECAAFQRAKFKLRPSMVPRMATHWYESLKALRTLLAWEKQPRILELQSGKPTPSSEDARLMMLLTGSQSGDEGTRAMLSEFLADTGLQCSLEDMERAHDILAINTLEVRARVGYGPAALFAGISMLEHSCSANVVYGRVSDESLQLQVLTSRDVKRGEHLARDYRRRAYPFEFSMLKVPFVNPFESRFDRRRQLVHRGLGFYCRCALCGDPDEMGLRMSGFCCENCPDQTVVSVTDTVVPNWHCPRCNKSGVDMGLHLQLMQEVRTVVSLTGEAQLRAAEDFLRRNLWPAGRLHATNYLVLQAKCLLAVRLDLGNTPDVAKTANFNLLSPANSSDISRQKGYLCEVLKILDVIRPGINTARGSLLDRLYQIKFQELRDLPMQTADPVKVQEMFAELRRMVKELEMLAFYPQAKAFFKRDAKEQTLEMLMTLKSLENMKGC